MTRARRHLTILDMILVIAGLAVGIWIAGGIFDEGPKDQDVWLAVGVFLLGGLSVIGPPLLVRERFRRRTRLGIGEMFWFCQGTASWLLWPPIVFYRFQGKPWGRGMAPVCYVYGTPLMALYIAIALLAGGWLGPRASRNWRCRSRRSWTETFGLLLGLVWACTGGYVLALIYRRDLFP